MRDENEVISNLKKNIDENRRRICLSDTSDGYDSDSSSESSEITEEDDRSIETDITDEDDESIEDNDILDNTSECYNVQLGIVYILVSKL